jgi:predicted PurR-regulated permease PerM
MIKPSALAGRSATRTAAILIAVIAVLYLAREILIPLAFAITVALILTPAVCWLQKLRVGRLPSVLLVMVVFIAVAGGIGWVIFTDLVQVISELPRYQENIHNKISAMHTSGESALGRAAESVKAIGKELSRAPAAPAAPPVGPLLPTESRGDTPNSSDHPVPVEIVAAPPNQLQYARDLVMPILGPLGTVGVILIFSVFLLVKQTDLRNRMFRLAGMDRLNVMTQALDDATHRVSRFLLLQLLVNASFGVLCGIGLYLIGVPYAALWGTVAGILRIVPYVGVLVAGALPLLLSLAVFDQWMPPLLVFLLFTILDLVTGNFVEPWLYGMHTGISSLALLLTAVFWAVLWGPAGLILSTPLTVCVVVLGRHIPRLSFLHVLLGDQPALTPEAQVYQRLLAMDDHEARAVADAYLSANSLVQLYDSVFIPALTLTEQDRHKGALDQVREEFIFLSMKEMIAEFSEKASVSGQSDTEDAPDGEPEPKLAVPGGRMICLAASDAADEIAATMLAQLLEQAGGTAVLLPLDPYLHMVSIVDPAPDDIFYLSAVPPFAFARARTLCRLLEVRFPRNRIVIGVWGFSGDPQKALQRFQPARKRQLVTSLADAVKCLVDTIPTGTAPAGTNNSVPTLPAPVS